MALDEREQRIADTIASVGWVVIQVRPEEEDGIWFAYTAGLPVTRKWPELICFGLGPEVMGEMLNNAVSEMERKGLSPAVGLTLTEVLGGFPAQLVPFEREYFDEHLGWSLWYSSLKELGPENIDCLQLVWPDADGRFPADPDCDIRARFVQTPALPEE